MRGLVFLLLIASLSCIGQEKKEDSASINKLVARIDKLSKANSKSFSKDKLIDHKKVKEQWRVFDKEFSRIIIQYTTDSAGQSFAYTEKYYLKNGSLIYAYESEVFFLTGENINEGTSWAGDFYFSKGKLTDYVTLGHARLELDDWDPEKEVLEKLKQRTAELSSAK